MIVKDKVKVQKSLYSAGPNPDNTLFPLSPTMPYQNIPLSLSAVCANAPDKPPPRSSHESQPWAHLQKRQMAPLQSRSASCLATPYSVWPPYTESRKPFFTPSRVMIIYFTAFICESYHIHLAHISHIYSSYETNMHSGAGTESAYPKIHRETNHCCI